MLAGCAACQSRAADSPCGAASWSSVDKIFPDIRQLNAALPPEVRVTQILAKGAQGAVFRGTVGQRAAAVKVYFSDQVELRVDREVEALARLASSNIAALLWSGEMPLSGRPTRVVATEFIAGSTLAEAIAQKPMEVDEIAEAVRDIASAIDNLWSIRLVHRDLKPSNIMMNGRSAVVIDLGVARHVDQLSLTATGSTWGTHGYMSPEQTRCAKQLTCKSDIFALGVIALECMLRQHPTQRVQMNLLAARLHERLPQAAVRHPLAPLVQRLLLTRPSARPTPADVMRDAASFMNRS
jgi:eukaryotic-like serine/threonine-protein kinase